MNDLTPFNFAFSGLPPGMEYGCLSLCEHCGWLRAENRDVKAENYELRRVLAELVVAAMKAFPNGPPTNASAEVKELDKAVQLAAHHLVRTQ